MWSSCYCTRFAQYILSGLDSTYDSIVTTPTARNDDINLEDFQAHLLSFDMHMETQNNILGATPTAHLAKCEPHSFKRTNNTDSNRMSRSFTNHINNAPRHQHLNSTRARSSLSGPCQLCGRKNHHVVNCWHRFDRDFYPHTVHTHGPASASSPTSYIATSQPVHASQWVPDSGATHHVTSDMNNLQLYYDYDGSDHMTIGNGNSVPVNHVGSSNGEGGTPRTA